MGSVCDFRGGAEATPSWLWKGGAYTDWAERTGEVGDEQVLRGGDRETRGSVWAACCLTNENRTKGVKVQGCGWDPASSGRGLVKRLG